jgi:hypothetical protein
MGEDYQQRARTTENGQGLPGTDMNKENTEPICEYIEPVSTCCFVCVCLCVFCFICRPMCFVCVCFVLYVCVLFVCVLFYMCFVLHICVLFACIVLCFTLGQE